MAKTNINYNKKKGITIPLVLCIILVIVCYLISLSWAMSISRDRYENTLNNQKAYYMARSAMEQIELKLVTMHKYCYESISNLENAPDDEKNFLFSVFIKDILKPLDKNQPFGVQRVIEKTLYLLTIGFIDKKGSILK